MLQEHRDVPLSPKEEFSVITKACFSDPYGELSATEIPDKYNLALWQQAGVGVPLSDSYKAAPPAPKAAAPPPAPPLPAQRWQIPNPSRSHRQLQGTRRVEQGNVMWMIVTCIFWGWLQSASGAEDCLLYQDSKGSAFKHTASRMKPCDGKPVGAGPGSACKYTLEQAIPGANTTWPERADLEVAGCCVNDVSGKAFCSSERSKHATPTASTIFDLLQIKYTCQGGGANVTEYCPGAQLSLLPGPGGADYPESRCLLEKPQRTGPLNPSRNCGCFQNGKMAPQNVPISNIVLKSGGAGYLIGSGGPSVRITGDGRGASASLTVDLSGRVESLEVTNFGEGYSWAEAVIERPDWAPSGGGATAIVIFNNKCRCEYPNVDAECTKDEECKAGSRCLGLSEIAKNILKAGLDDDLWEKSRQPDGSFEMRTKPTSWFGNDQFDSRRATADVWSWKDDNGQWIPFDDFNQMALLQAFDDDRKTAIVEFAGFRRGSVTVNIEEMTMHDSASKDKKRRPVRRDTTAGQQKAPPTLNGQVDVSKLSDIEAVRRATVLP